MSLILYPIVLKGLSFFLQCMITQATVHRSLWERKEGIKILYTCHGFEVSFFKKTIFPSADWSECEKWLMSGEWTTDYSFTSRQLTSSTLDFFLLYYLYRTGCSFILPLVTTRSINISMGPFRSVPLVAILILVPL